MESTPDKAPGILRPGAGCHRIRLEAALAGDLVSEPPAPGASACARRSAKRRFTGPDGCTPRGFAAKKISVEGPANRSSALPRSSSSGRAAELAVVVDAGAGGPLSVPAQWFVARPTRPTRRRKPHRARRERFTARPARGRNGCTRGLGAGRYFAVTIPLVHGLRIGRVPFEGSPHSSVERTAALDLRSEEW